MKLEGTAKENNKIQFENNNEPKQPSPYKLYWVIPSWICIGIAVFSFSFAEDITVIGVIAIIILIIDTGIWLKNFVKEFKEYQKALEKYEKSKNNSFENVFKEPTQTADRCPACGVAALI